MGEVQIVVEGLNEFGRRLDTARQTSARQMDLLVDRTAHLARDEARRRVPRGPSGAARASLRVVEGVGTAQLIGGSRRAPYYGWLDFGGFAGRSRPGRRGARRPYRRGGRYIFPALVDRWQATQDDAARALDAAMADVGLAD
jgi:hypothetical protein